MHWSMILCLAWTTSGARPVGYGQELSVKEAERVPVPRPVNIKLREMEGCLSISWDPTPIKRVTGYEIFKKIDKGDPVRVGRKEKSPFVTKSIPVRPTDYFVVAVDYRGNRSRPSEMVAYPPHK